ncbi:hypothetical protein OVA07_00995 [Novosphingobium sp. SL115]|uniref:hypothetical protein n=1 Tax=Novosphingobium sp. SL115 TaxID=2995150 RepID=UPI00227442B9|nr:hypothetical protein [Novosphingobium sp. SL115]MCY1669588.1 hypothetical protein [Novosphingobium sp. SL115]
MSGIISPTDIAACADALEHLCARVAMARQTELPRLADVAEPPSGAALWSSNYAQLVLWPVASNEGEVIARATDEGEGWLDAVLAHADRSPAIPLDGYLVLALPAAPAPEADEEIRKVELSARICRKHLVWPSSPEAVAEGAGPWARVADVTMLGLPDATAAASNGLYWPEIGGNAEALWQELQHKGAPSVAQSDAEAPIPAEKPV